MQIIAHGDKEFLGHLIFFTFYFETICNKQLVEYPGIIPNQIKSNSNRPSNLSDGINLFSYDF